MNRWIGEEPEKRADAKDLVSKYPLDPWWDRFAGLTCTCPPGCTDRTWGDGGTCARGCVPCREMQGAPYVPKPKSKKAAPDGQVNTTEESDAA